MGEEVSEFHIVEGDHDFKGGSKPYSFDKLLNSGKLDLWKHKITYHKAKIPMGVTTYNLQHTQRLAEFNQENARKRKVYYLYSYLYSKPKESPLV